MGKESTVAEAMGGRIQKKIPEKKITTGGTISKGSTTGRSEEKKN